MSLESYKGYTKDWATKELAIPIDEMVHEYRLAKNKEEQIDILADQCGTKPCRIAWILDRCGLDVTPWKMPRASDHVAIWESSEDAVVCDRIREQMRELAGEAVEKLREIVEKEPEMVEIWTGGTETETVPKEIGMGEEKDMTDTVVSEDKIVERLEEGLGATIVKEPGMERKRKALIEFCGERVCTDCPLGTDGHKCGAGYSFRCGICEPGYITDAEVEEAYKLAFPGKEDAQMHEGIATGNAVGEEKTGCEKYRNYCDCCARQKSGACNVCESGYDGVPSEYLYELARKSQADIRGDILEQAKICVCTDRKEQYGEAEQSFRCIADMWNAYLRPVYPDICITPVQASMMMVLFKAARDAVAKVHKVDTYVDMCGYAACAGGMLE